jgi:cytochrome c-type biogenesis protein CcmH/NrfG
MNGMEMMLKAFGLDPEQIKAEMLGSIKAFQDALAALQKRLDVLDARQERLEKLLENIAVKVEAEIPSDETRHPLRSIQQ